jgi:hypothetical protein
MTTTIGKMQWCLKCSKACKLGTSYKCVECKHYQSQHCSAKPQTSADATAVLSNKAATLIQSAARGKQARTLVNTMKQQEAKQAAASSSATDKPKPQSFNFALRTVTSLHGIAWQSAVRAVKMSASGSQGVFFVELDEGKQAGRAALVVKASREIAPEIYTALMAKRCGIDAPRMRIVQRQSTEGIALFKALRAKDPYNVDWKLKAKYLLVMDLLHGDSLWDMAPSQLKALLKKHGAGMMRGLGAMCAFDMLMQYSDRAPFIANNKGNGGNILFDKSNGNVLAMDSGVMCIRIKYAANYATKVATTLRALFKAPHTTLLAGTKKIQNMFAEVMAPITDADALLIQAGVRDWVAKYGATLRTADLMAPKRALEQIPNLLGVDAIRPEFFELMLLLYRRKGELVAEDGKTPSSIEAIIKEAVSNVATRKNGAGAGTATESKSNATSTTNSTAAAAAAAVKQDAAKGIAALDAMYSAIE